MPRALCAPLLLGLLVAAACRGGAGKPPAPAAPAAPRDGDRVPVVDSTAPRRTFGGARPATVLGPRPGPGPASLVLVLHGYGDTGMGLASHLGFVELARRERVVVVVPDGTRDGRGARYWTATDACCDFGGHELDDVGYLRRLVAEVRAAFAVDPGRVFVVGLSNGGFMAHRLACDAPDDFAAIVSIAGVPWQDASRCRPRRPVSVLQVHPDADRLVRYAGGHDLLGLGGPRYPGAAETVARWAALDGCGGAPAATGRELDLDAAVAGTETLVATAAGCPAGVAVELWTMRGSAHVPAFNDTFAHLALAWLEAHARPSRAQGPASTGSK